MTVVVGVEGGHPWHTLKTAFHNMPACKNEAEGTDSDMLVVAGAGVGVAENLAAQLQCLSRRQRGVRRCLAAVEVRYHLQPQI